MSENKQKKESNEQLNQDNQKAQCKPCKNEDKQCEKHDKCKNSHFEKRIAELEESLANSQKQAEEYKEKWYRSAAEFENYKKRHNGERAQAYADGQGDVIKSILTVGDNLDRAVQTTVDEKTRVGLELVVKQFGETLANLNVKVINPVGETFDPNFAEAVHQVEPEEGDESGTVKSVFRKGYSLNGKILRYAQVIVIK